MSSNTKDELANPIEGWVTMKEAGEIIDREAATVRYWAETGKIVSYHVGTSNIRIVNVAQVKEYSEKHSYRLPPEKRGRLRNKNKKSMKSEN